MKFIHPELPEQSVGELVENRKDVFQTYPSLYVNVISVKLQCLFPSQFLFYISQFKSKLKYFITNKENSRSVNHGFN